MKPPETDLRFDRELHVAIVVGWGPDRPDLPNGQPNPSYSFTSWKQNYRGELYATWHDIPENLRDSYVPYVMDRGRRETPSGVEDYAIRGPHPFHSQYSVSYVKFWVAQSNLVTRQ